MGHERLGGLPKTKPWRQIVGSVAASAQGTGNVASLANQTLEQVRSQFGRLKGDPATVGVFATLVQIAVSCRGSTDGGLRALLATAESPTPLALARRLHREAETEGAPEYAAIAASAASDALAEWYDRTRPREESLFQSLRTPYETWRHLSSAAGFCELARLFFARSTERYLNYFLERSASEVAPDLAARERFRDSLHRHVADTSLHAFETAKITQSFAAGWFNKHARETTPDRESVQGFVSFAFDKMREALAREAREE